MFIGNRLLQSYFEGLANQGRLAQGYTLVGPHQVGKKTLATIVAASALKTTIDKVFTHPDFLFLDRGIDEKSGKPKTEISVASARALRSRLQEKSWGTGQRIAIIDEAETLSVEAANALLKIVEEPPEKTTLFFLTDRADALPATILSRTEVLYLQIVPETEILAALVELGAPRTTAQRLANVSWGRPGRALSLHGSPDTLAEEEARIVLLEKLLAAPISEQGTLIAGLTEKKEGARVSDEVSETVASWLMHIRHSLRETANKNIENSDAMERLRRLADSLHEAKIQLRQNVNPRLLLETIFLNQSV